MFTETLKERQVLASANITAINNAATASINTGNGINMGIVRRARAFLHLQTANGSLVNFSLLASATSGGTFAAITGLTTLPALTGLNTNNAWYAIEISSDMMPAGKPWLQAIASETNNVAVTADLFIIGDESAYKPASSQSPALSTATITNNVVAAP
jgi:hypothetical protein